MAGRALPRGIPGGAGRAGAATAARRNGPRGRPEGRPAAARGPGSASSAAADSRRPESIAGNQDRPARAASSGPDRFTINLAVILGRDRAAAGRRPCPDAWPRPPRPRPFCATRSAARHRARLRQSRLEHTPRPRALRRNRRDPARRRIGPPGRASPGGRSPEAARRMNGLRWSRATKRRCGRACGCRRCAGRRTADAARSAAIREPGIRQAGSRTNADCQTGAAAAAGARTRSCGITACRCRNSGAGRGGRCVRGRPGSCGSAADGRPRPHAPGWRVPHSGRANARTGRRPPAAAAGDPKRNVAAGRPPTCRHPPQRTPACAEPLRAQAAPARGIIPGRIGHGWSPNDPRIRRHPSRQIRARRRGTAADLARAASGRADLRTSPRTCRPRAQMRLCWPGSRLIGGKSGLVPASRCRLTSKPKPRLAATNHPPIPRLDHNGRKSTRRRAP